MSRDDWKDMLEGIGIIAIVASLVFLAIETQNSTRQAELNTRALEAAAYQDLIDNISTLNALTLENPDVADLMYKAFGTDEDLTERESFLFSRAMFMRFRHGDMAYFQYERGAIDEARLRTVIRVLNLPNPRVQEYWSRQKDNFVASYREYIDRAIEEVGTSGSAD